MDEDFLLFLSQQEKKLVKKAMNSFSTLTETEKDVLIEFFQSYELNELPKENEIQQQIRTIAENILNKEPYELIKKMRDGIPLVCEPFFTNLTHEKLKLWYKIQLPTPLKIINCLETVPSELNNAQSKVFYFFKTFIRNLNDINLTKFLLFITSSESMPEKIIVHFKHFGFPVAHSCSNTIELATIYSHYQELADVFLAIINNESCYEYSIL